MIKKLGLCWLQPEQWLQAQALFEDSDKLGATYEAYQKNTSEAIFQLEAIGAHPQKVHVDLDAFEQWCKNSGHSPNINACSQFVKVIMENSK